MPFEFSQPLQARFLDALASSGSVDRACEATNVSRDFALRQRTHDAAFRAAWADVISSALIERADGARVQP